MNRITRQIPAVLVCMVFVLPVSNAFAQDDDDGAAARAREEMRQNQEQQRERMEQEQQSRIQESREQFVNADMDQAKRAVEGFSRPTPRIEREFMVAVPQFRKAVSSYREALSLKDSLKDSRKELDRFVDLFKEYFKTTHVDFPVMDKTEFNGFSKKDLVWETLSTAERVDGDLRLAVRKLREANTTNEVSIETVIFMRDLHGEVLRLEMLLSKVK